MKRRKRGLISPCEAAVWVIIPAIRREIVRILVEEMSMMQREVVELLGITEAAVSQYLNGKRGVGVKISGDLREKVREVAVKVAEKGDASPLAEKTCELCRMVRAEMGDAWR